MMDGVFVKKMNVGKSPLVLLLLILLSCGSNDKKSIADSESLEISIDLSRYNQTFPVDSIDYRVDSLFLDPTGSVVVGNVDNILILDTCIVVNDRNQAKQIFVFKMDGTFSHYIGKNGRGPGEYLQATDIAYHNGYLVVLDMLSRKLIRYSLGGVFIEETEYKDKLHEIESDGEILFAYAGDNRHNADIKNCEFLVLGQSGEVNEAYHYNRYSINYKSGDNIRLIGENVYFTRALLPYVCQYEQTRGLSKKYLLNLGPNPLREDFEKECKGDYSRFEEVYRQSASYYTGNFWETSRYAGFSVEYNRLPYLVVHDKVSGDVFAGIVGIAGKDKLEYSDLVPILLSGPVVVDSNSIYAVVESGILQDETNPVIIKILM